MTASRSLSITQLFEEHIEKLKLNWVGAVGVDRHVALKDQETYGPDVVGHMNLIYSHRVQVIGKAEQYWAERVGSERWLQQINDLVAAGSEQAAKQAGKVRTEGKTYIMQPDDVVEFRFNV